MLRLDEDNADVGATRFRWDVFALAGDPNTTAAFTLPGGVAADVSVTLNGAPTFTGDRFSCPDNLCFDSSDNVWIATDGSYAVFPDCNDCVMVTPTTAERPRPVAIGRFDKGSWSAPRTPSSAARTPPSVRALNAPLTAAGPR